MEKENNSLEDLLFDETFAPPSLSLVALAAADMDASRATSSTDYNSVVSTMCIALACGEVAVAAMTSHLALLRVCIFNAYSS